MGINFVKFKVDHLLKNLVSTKRKSDEYNPEVTGNNQFEPEDILAIDPPFKIPKRDQTKPSTTRSKKRQTLEEVKQKEKEAATKTLQNAINSVEQNVHENALKDIVEGNKALANLAALPPTETTEDDIDFLKGKFYFKFNFKF